MTVSEMLEQLKMLVDAGKGGDIIGVKGYCNQWESLTGPVEVLTTLDYWAGQGLVDEKDEPRFVKELENETPIRLQVVAYVGGLS